MKHDIDSLLEGMFRNGKLNFKNTGSAEEKEPPQLVWGPAENSAQAQKAANATEQAVTRTAADLRQSMEQLTKDAQAEMADLRQHLKEDGVESQSVKNTGAQKDLEAAFAAAQREAGEEVLGQEGFLSDLAIAFKRPFVAGNDTGGPLCRACVMGKRGTGRHTALESIAGSLARQGVLKSPKLSWIDLSDYGEPGSEKLFLQDLYAALKSGSCGLVFENFEGCHPSVLPLVSALFREGEAPLPGRYAEQKGILADVGSALVPGAVYSLSAAGKYLFLLTDKSRTEIADAFGMPFLSAVDDLCGTGGFSPESLGAIGEKILNDLCRRVRTKLGFAFTYDKKAEEVLTAAYTPSRGVTAMTEEADKLYRAMGEIKLRNGLSGLSGTISGENGRLAASYKTEKTAGDAGVISGADDGGDAARREAVRAVKREMDAIVGLQEVKEYILSLEDNFQIQQLRREKGLKAESPSMHMIFTGNPGTGKTTVARIVSRYLKAIGVLSGGQLVEVTRADLVGRYVGHTAPLTSRAIQSALGGVLFIDEAYSLYRGKDDSFGLEAIDTLVKGMEDHRDELIVILAGYSREMEEFLSANSGLKSRFPNIIEFPDYTGEELLAITKSIVAGKGYRLSPDCDKPLLDFYKRAQTEGDPRTNGNGRMARNKVEEAILNCSRRNLRIPEEERDLETLLPEDFALQEESAC